MSTEHAGYATGDTAVPVAISHTYAEIKKAHDLAVSFLRS